MDSKTLSEKLWDLANIITGFSILQAIAISIAIGKIEIKQLQGSAAGWSTFFLTLICSTAYVVGVWACHRMAVSLDSSQKHIWLTVTWGRTAAIALFTLIVFVALLGNWKAETKPHPAQQTASPAS